MSNFEVHEPRVTLVMVGSNHVRNGNSDGVSAEPFSLSGLSALLSFSAAFHFLFPILGVSLKENVSCHHIHSPAGVSHYQNKKSPHTSLGHCSRVHRSKLRSVFQLAIIICIHETNFSLVSHSLVVSQALTLSGCPAVIQSIAEPGGPPRSNLVHAPNSTQEKCLTSSEFYSSLNCQKPLMAKEVCQFVQRPKVFLLSSLETKSNWSVSLFLNDTSNDGY